MKLWTLLFSGLVILSWSCSNSTGEEATNVKEDIVSETGRFIPGIYLTQSGVEWETAVSNAIKSGVMNQPYRHAGGIIYYPTIIKFEQPISAETYFDFQEVPGKKILSGISINMASEKSKEDDGSGVDLVKIEGSSLPVHTRYCSVDSYNAVKGYLSSRFQLFDSTTNEETDEVSYWYHQPSYYIKLTRSSFVDSTKRIPKAHWINAMVEIVLK